MNLQARLYDPVIGRFLSVDPLAEIQLGITPYHYCGNDPINAKDPSGLFQDYSRVIKRDALELSNLNESSARNANIENYNSELVRAVHAGNLFLYIQYVNNQMSQRYHPGSNGMVAQNSGGDTKNGYTYIFDKDGYCSASFSNGTPYDDHAYVDMTSEEIYNTTDDEFDAICDNLLAESNTSWGNELGPDRQQEAFDNLSLFNDLGNLFGAVSSVLENSQLITPAAGFGAATSSILSGTIIDYYLASKEQISWWKVGANFGVNCLGFYLKGWRGAALSGGYFIFDKSIGWKWLDDLKIPNNFNSHYFTPGGPK